MTLRRQACKAKLGWVEAVIDPSREARLLWLLTWCYGQRPSMSLARYLPRQLLLLVVLQRGSRHASWACTG